MIDTKIFTALTELKAQVKINCQYLQSILKKMEARQVAMGVGDNTELPDGIVLPLKVCAGGPGPRRKV